MAHFVPQQQQEYPPGDNWAAAGAATGGPPGPQNARYQLQGPEVMEPVGPAAQQNAQYRPQVMEPVGPAAQQNAQYRPQVMEPVGPAAQQNAQYRPQGLGQQGQYQPPLGHGVQHGPPPGLQNAPYHPQGQAPTMRIVAGPPQGPQNVQYQVAGPAPQGPYQVGPGIPPGNAPSHAQPAIYHVCATGAGAHPRIWPPGAHGMMPGGHPYGRGAYRPVNAQGPVDWNQYFPGALDGGTAGTGRYPPAGNHPGQDVDLRTPFVIPRDGGKTRVRAAGPDAVLEGRPKRRAVARTDGAGPSRAAEPAALPVLDVTELPNYVPVSRSPRSGDNADNEVREGEGTAGLDENQVDGINESDIPTCPICFEFFSLDLKPYLLPNCGHSVCDRCKEMSERCGVCNSNVKIQQYMQEVWPDWRVNYPLLDSATALDRARIAANKRELASQKELEKLRAENEEAKRLADLLATRVECVSCGEKEKRERMNICRQCAKEKGVEGAEGEERMRRFIVCGSCAFSDHRNHDVTKFVLWETNKIVCKGIEETSSMDELCVDAFNKGRSALESWNSVLRSLASIGDTTSVEGAVTMNAAIKDECELVCEAREQTLPALRLFAKVTKESCERLRSLGAESTLEEMPPT